MMRVHFRDGFTGGILTTDHARSSYGVPVFVPDARTAGYLSAPAYGPGDLLGEPAFVCDEGTEEEVAVARAGGFRIEETIPEMLRRVHS